MLQADGTAGDDTRELGVVDDLLAVERDADAVAFERDQKTVPLAELRVGDFFRRDGGPHFGRQLLVRAKGGDFAGADRVAANVDLRVLAAAEQNAAVAPVIDLARDDFPLL